VLERVHVGRHPAEDGRLLVRRGTRLGVRHHQRRLGLGDRLGGEGQLAAAGRVVTEEVLTEDLVVDAFVLVAAQQRGPPGPVQVDQVGRVERGHRGQVAEDVAGADPEPGGPQRPAEAEHDPGQLVARGPLSHRR
jgi:hypothetical protein